jgi:hypothetical protein
MMSPAGYYIRYGSFNRPSHLSATNANVGRTQAITEEGMFVFMNTSISILQKVLITSGILASLLYFGTDRLAGSLIKGYSFSAQSMSDVSAIGSPQRRLAALLTGVACVFMIAFGVGVWLVSDQVLLIRVVSVFIIGNAMFGLIATLFFPTHYGVRPNFISAGVLIMFSSVLCFVLAMVLGAVAINGWFRIFSIAIPAAYLLLAILRFATAKNSSTGEIVPLIGTQERTMSYSYLLWVFVLSLYFRSLW